MKSILRLLALGAAIGIASLSSPATAAVGNCRILCFSSGTVTTIYKTTSAFTCCSDRDACPPGSQWMGASYASASGVWTNCLPE